MYYSQGPHRCHLAFGTHMHMRREALTKTNREGEVAVEESLKQCFSEPKKIKHCCSQRNARCETETHRIFRRLRGRVSSDPSSHGSKHCRLLGEGLRTKRELGPMVRPVVQTLAGNEGHTGKPMFWRRCLEMFVHIGREPILPF